MMALGLELKRRGHDPVIATAAFYADKITEAGLGFHAIRPNLTPADRELLRHAMDERHGPERLVRGVMMPAVRNTYEDLTRGLNDADILLGADLVYAAPVAAEVMKLPWIAVTMAPLSFFSRHDPPVLPPAPWLAKLARVSKPAYAAIVRFGQWSARPWARPVYELRRELGLSRGLEPLFEARTKADALLGMFSPLVGPPQPDWPANAKATGFAFYDRHVPMTNDLRRFLDAGDPPIVFTLGSAAVFDPGEFYRESARAAARLRQRAVLLVGPEPENVPPPSERLFIADYAPFSELFPRAAAIVHQGGIGTTAQALRAGRPMLIIPYSHDQPDNAARMIRLGVGRTIRRRKYSAATAAAALEPLLNDPAYARRAAQAAAQLQHEDGAAAAANEIERIIFRRSAAPARESSAIGSS